ncbi:MAG: dihydroorotase [Prevotella sp.]|nr:dihydroorotase [Prevotella sp.]
MRQTLITNGRIVNEGQSFDGFVVIEGDSIKSIGKGEAPRGDYDETVDATGCLVLPGIIDDHVHFREPGLTHKADMASESRAAAAGGVTSYLDMPNTVPQTTTLEALQDKRDRARQKSLVNYGFFFGATNGNSDLFASLDRHAVPGIKLFMGSSTGNMLVDKYGSLLKVFAEAARLGLPVMAHCEDTDIINRNMEQMKKAYGDDPDVMLHPLIRSEEACFESAALAAALARQFGTRLHIAHVSTGRELALAADNVTLEATVAHLFFSSADYAQKGSLIKCNPAIKRPEDREALRRGIADGTISVVGTDHAPHLLADKQGGAAKATSGMPMVQFSLVTMLELADKGVVTMERLVELMCHNPARLFSISRRGFLRPGYHADIAIVQRGEPWTVGKDIILSKCKWSPMEGHCYDWRVRRTICNGHTVYADGHVIDDTLGQELTFRTDDNTL